jgi:hypothetical protein
MNIKKIIKYTLIAVPLLFLAKWGIEKVVYDSNKIPEVNQDSKEKMRIYGKFPFEKDIDLSIAIIYINKNPKCDRKVWGTGIQFPQKQEVTFLTTAKGGNFESIVNLDNYLPGICNWRPHRIYASMESGNELAIRGDVRAGGTAIRPAMTYVASIENNNALNKNTSIILCSYEKQTFSKGYPDERTKTFLKCNSENYLKYNIPHSQKEIEVNIKLEGEE